MCSLHLAFALRRHVVVTTAPGLVKAFACRVERFVFRVIVEFRFGQYMIRCMFLFGVSFRIGVLWPSRHDCEQVQAIRVQVGRYTTNSDKHCLYCQ